jgi:hypothetical protein
MVVLNGAYPQLAVRGSGTSGRRWLVRIAKSAQISRQPGGLPGRPVREATMEIQSLQIDRAPSGAGFVCLGGAETISNVCNAKCPHCVPGICDSQHDRGYHHCTSCGKHWIIT